MISCALPGIYKVLKTFAEKVLRHQKYLYVVATVLISGLGFARNFVFMQFLGLGDVGQIALMQTIVMLIGFVQIGLINGGYRIYAIGDSDQKKVNDVLFSYLLIAIIALTLIVWLSLVFLQSPEVKGLTVSIGAAAGMATLASVWLNNTLIAHGKLMVSNAVNLIAVTVSFIVGIIAVPHGLWAALLAILIQPLGMVILVLVFQRKMRPTQFIIDFELSKRILKLGFMPFFTGILLLGSYQIERWSVVSVLGSDALGLFYLAILYTTIFVLVPVALLNLYYPSAIRAFEAKNLPEFKRIVKRHFLELLIYFALSMLITLSLLHYTLANYLPLYLDSEYLVYLAIPGLLAFSLGDVASLILLSIRWMRPLVIWGGIVLATDAIILMVLYKTDQFTLEMVVLAKTAAFILGFIYLVSVVFSLRTGERFESTPL